MHAHGAGADVRSIDLFALDTGASMGQVEFSNADGSAMGEPAFHAMRIRRADLLQGALDAVKAQDNVHVEFGKMVVALEQDDDSVTVSFADGSAASATLLLGCDGIHSGVRQVLEPSRATQYTDIAIVNGYTTSISDGVFVPERDTSFLSTQTGRFFATYFEPSRSKLFVTGLWDTPEVESRDGWRAKGSDQLALEKELKGRFGTGAIQGVNELIDAVPDWSLYPVYKLPPNGKWWEGRVLLLGDAAHAVSLNV
jgi:2-polyprenyl-6-methoxyphenol hydroxylase-like FAD-dependent oxidoreductase